MLRIVVASSIAFYVGWWMAHEHYEDLGPHHVHVFGPHYWKLAIPLTSLWWFLIVKNRPFVLSVILAANALFCSVRLPFHTEGIPPSVAFSAFILAVLLVVLTFPVMQILLRSQRLVFVYPETVKSIRNYACRGYQPIAQGWSFWLQYSRAPQKSMIFAKNWSGVMFISENKVRVKSGTTFAELRRVLKSENMALQDRSQFDELSIGGAVATRAHGWSARETFMDLVEQLDVVRRHTGQQMTIPVQRFTNDMIIVYVTLRVTKDVPYVVEKRNVNTIVDFWFSSHTFRLALVHKHGISLCIAKRKEDDEDHPVQTQLQTRCEQIGFLCTGSMTSHKTNVLLSDIHTIFTRMWPVEFLFIHVLGYRNAEFFTRDHIDIRALCRSLHMFHKHHGGHTELRQHGHTLCLDMALQDRPPWKNFQLYKEVLHQEGITTTNLHLGKWHPPL